MLILLLKKILLKHFIYTVLLYLSVFLLIFCVSFNYCDRCTSIFGLVHQHSNFSSYSFIVTQINSHYSLPPIANYLYLTLFTVPTVKHNFLTVIDCFTLHFFIFVFRQRWVMMGHVEITLR